MPAAGQVIQMQIEVLRLSHRLPRDERISTHVALVARAFGASKIFYSGQHDSGLEKSVQRICDRWGADASPHGSFSISYEKRPIPLIREKKKSGFSIVHLTMYGIPVQESFKKLRKLKKILLVVGSEHVPGEVYSLADFNMSVTSQPHSEVAALAIALDRIFDGKELENIFNGKVHIEPQECGKKVVKKE